MRLADGVPAWKKDAESGRTFGLEGDEGDVELPLVSHHEHVGDARVQALDVVLKRHRRNVLTPGADDDLLVPARDLEHAALVLGTLVAAVKPAVLVDSFGKLLLNRTDVLRLRAQDKFLVHSAHQGIHVSATPAPRDAAVDPSKKQLPSMKARNAT